jgi:thioredoxin reductase (NADPH)
MYDILIIGAGPAGLSAAITARARDKSVLLVSNAARDGGLYKSPAVDNYPGIPGVLGAELLDKMTAHAISLGAEIRSARVVSAMAGDTFGVSYGSEAETGRALILALGVAQTSVFPGEAELLGRGVSYCATCDGMLYRKKRVVVVDKSPDAAEEAEFLRKIGCDVVETRTDKLEIIGESKVTGVIADGERIDCDAVFILRKTIAPASLLAGLATQDGHIAVNRDFSTNLAGVFAAGDCTGAPYQIAKAVGEGQCAALSAGKFTDNN